MAELGNQRVQVLSLSGLPLQSLQCDGPASGVCADDEHVCTTSLEGCALVRAERRASPVIQTSPAIHSCMTAQLHDCTAARLHGCTAHEVTHVLLTRHLGPICASTPCLLGCTCSGITLLRCDL